MGRDVRSMLLVAAALAANACDADGGDPHGHVDAAVDAQDGAPRDVVAALDRLDEDVPIDGGHAAAVDGSTADLLEAGNAVCSPPCGAGEVCCADQHGHFPACRTGLACPDSGGR